MITSKSAHPRGMQAICLYPPIFDKSVGADQFQRGSALLDTMELQWNVAVLHLSERHLQGNMGGSEEVH